VRGKSHRHFLAEAGPASGHQNALSVKYVAGEHGRGILIGVAVKKTNTLPYLICKPVPASTF
jgi:hypothetical protein